MLYRVKIMSAGGRGIDAHTMETSSPRKIRSWGKKVKEKYPNNSVVVQHKTGAGWRDYRLIDDF